MKQAVDKNKIKTKSSLIAKILSIYMIEVITIVSAFKNKLFLIHKF